MSVAALDGELAELEAAFSRGLVLSDDYRVKKMDIQQRKESLLSLCIEALRRAKVTKEEDELQQRVLHAIQSQGECTIADVERDVPAPRASIVKTMQYLCNEGWIYTTIDEHHWRAVDGLQRSLEPAFYMKQQ